MSTIKKNSLSKTKLSKFQASKDNFNASQVNPIEQEIPNIKAKENNYVGSSIEIIDADSDYVPEFSNEYKSKTNSNLDNEGTDLSPTCPEIKNCDIITISSNSTPLDTTICNENAMKTTRFYDLTSSKSDRSSQNKRSSNSSILDYFDASNLKSDPLNRLTTIPPGHSRRLPHSSKQAFYKQTDGLRLIKKLPLELVNSLPKDVIEDLKKYSSTRDSDFTFSTFDLNLFEHNLAKLLSFATKSEQSSDPFKQVYKYIEGCKGIFTRKLCFSFLNYFFSKQLKDKEAVREISKLRQLITYIDPKALNLFNQREYVAYLHDLGEPQILISRQHGKKFKAKEVEVIQKHVKNNGVPYYDLNVNGKILKMVSLKDLEPYLEAIEEFEHKLWDSKKNYYS